MLKSNPLVVIVDDEVNVCNILRRIMEMEGYQVISALDGKTAICLIEEKQPDVVILDLMMPGVDGREVCERTRELSPATRIIYFTAKAGAANALETKEIYQEADAYLAKPATKRQILTKVNGMLQGSGNDLQPGPDELEL